MKNNIFWLDKNYKLSTQHTAKTFKSLLENISTRTAINNLIQTNVLQIVECNSIEKIMIWPNLILNNIQGIESLPQIHSWKYQGSTTLGCKVVGIR